LRSVVAHALSVLVLPNAVVGVNAGCGFDFKTNKCVKAAGSAINPLAKNKQQCTSFANSQAVRYC
jgi:outer membrane lipopolysaccharide assembly protein LptE/RlpB